MYIKSALLLVIKEAQIETILRYHHTDGPGKIF